MEVGAYGPRRADMNLGANVRAIFFEHEDGLGLAAIVDHISCDEIEPAVENAREIGDELLGVYDRVLLGKELIDQLSRDGEVDGERPAIDSVAGPCLPFGTKRRL